MIKVSVVTYDLAGLDPAVPDWLLKDRCRAEDGEGLAGCRECGEGARGVVRDDGDSVSGFPDNFFFNQTLISKNLSRLWSWLKIWSGSIRLWFSFFIQTLIEKFSADLD